jgi:hypothetical protein
VLAIGWGAAFLSRRDLLKSIIRQAAACRRISPKLS